MLVTPVPFHLKHSSEPHGYKTQKDKHEGKISIHTKNSGTYVVKCRTLYKIMSHFNLLYKLENIHFQILFYEAFITLIPKSEKGLPREEGRGRGDYKSICLSNLKFKNINKILGNQV